MVFTHIQVHIIVSIGSFDSKLEDNEKGVMAGVASPNDPIFINHHTMIVCSLEHIIMFEERIERNNVTILLVPLQFAWYIRRIICTRVSLKPLLQDAVNHGMMVDA